MRRAEDAPLGLQDLAVGRFCFGIFLFLQKSIADVAQIGQNLWIILAERPSVQIIDLPKAFFRVRELSLVGQTNGQILLKTDQQFLVSIFVVLKIQQTLAKNGFRFRVTALFAEQIAKAAGRSESLGIGRAELLSG